MGLWSDLQWRGLVHQWTAEDLGQILETQKITFYNGYDPTATSLHVGNLVALTLMKHLQGAGHKVIGLVGGGTGLIGDPSGKSAERNLLSLEKAAENGKLIHAQIMKVLDAADNPPIYANNLDWLGTMGLLEFLRDTGKHFAVNAMIQKDSVKNRIEREGEGISFTEFTYSLLQARDFLELYRRYGCTMQTGGSDQWGNIVGGTDLIRRAEGARAFGLTVPLLLNSEGNKFGKSEKGAIYLDGALTSPYSFYQFWLNTSDADAIRLMKLFTFLPREQIEAMEPQVGDGARPVQKLLAETMTKQIHGADEAAKAIAASAALFSGDIQGLPTATLLEIFAEVPAVEIARDRAAQGVTLLDLLVESGACPSKSDARRQVQQGAVRLNGGEAVTGEPTLTANDFIDGQVLVIRRGKKNYSLVKLVG